MIEILFLIILKIFFSIFIFPNVILALRAMMFYISTIHAKRDQTARPTSEKRNQSKFFVIHVKNTIIDFTKKKFFFSDVGLAA